MTVLNLKVREITKEKKKKTPSFPNLNFNSYPLFPAWRQRIGVELVKNSKNTAMIRWKLRNHWNWQFGIFFIHEILWINLLKQSSISLSKENSKTTETQCYTLSVMDFWHFFRPNFSLPQINRSYLIFMNDLKLQNLLHNRYLTSIQFISLHHPLKVAGSEEISKTLKLENYILLAGKKRNLVWNSS